MIGKDSSGFDFDVKSGESKGMLLKPVLLHLLELDISVNYHTLLHREYGVCMYSEDLPLHSVSPRIVMAWRDSEPLLIRSGRDLCLLHIRSTEYIM